MFIKLSNVSKMYGEGEAEVRALKNISFSVEAGEYAVVYGPSGSGKTTLLTIMAGLHRPTAGKIEIDGISIYDELDQNGLARLRSEYMGFVFQAFNLVPYLTALENVLLPLAPLKMSGKKKREMAGEALSSVGIEDRATHIPAELSGGQVQRVAVARAIVNDPFIIFADEPTGNLDSGTRDEIMELFTELNRGGRTLVLVTHDPDRVTRAGRWLHINDGEVKEKQPA
jgi:putative ABC transport system ATP-binding protein